MNRNPKADAYMQALDNPLKDLWEQIREIILGVDPRITEEIKWSTLTFICKSNLASFNPRAKRFVNRMFHSGALIDDPDGVLEGDSKEVRVFRAATVEELSRKRAGLEKVVANWIQLKDQ